ncbi:MAG TPA: hypothetical protein VFX30_04600 [bacterium]|nr:hypothetical protein [bacterium]
MIQLSLQGITQVFAAGMVRSQEQLTSGPVRFSDGVSPEQIGHYVTAGDALRASQALSGALKLPGKIPGAAVFEALGRKPHFHRVAVSGELPLLETGWLMLKDVAIGLYLSAEETMRYQDALMTAHRTPDRTLLQGLRVLLEPRSVYPALPDLAPLGVNDPVDRAIAAAMLSRLLKAGGRPIEDGPFSLEAIKAAWWGLDSIGWLNWIGETERDLEVMLTDDQMFDQNKADFAQGFLGLLAALRSHLV